jgi:hypothetical protein
MDGGRQRQFESAGRSLAGALAHIGNGDLKTAAALLRSAAKYLDGASDRRKLVAVVMPRIRG